MATAAKKMIDADHRRFVGESLMLARQARGKRPSDWVKQYPSWLPSQSKLTNWEKGDHYPPPLFLMRLCDDYGLTMDWFYRRVLAGVSSESADALRQAEAERSAAPPVRERLSA